MTTAALHESAATSWHTDVLSPELALVDPRLAEYARSLLQGPETRVRAEANSDTARAATGDAPHAVTAPDHVDDARARLLQAGVASEVVGGVVRSERRFRRSTTLVATSSAATASALLAVQVVLGLTALG